MQGLDQLEQHESCDGMQLPASYLHHAPGSEKNTVCLPLTDAEILLAATVQDWSVIGHACH